jgi:hypothetical protein
MLACRPLAERSTRSDLRFVRVQGLEETSQLALIWHTDRTSPQLSALARLMAEAHRALAPPTNAAVPPDRHDRTDLVDGLRADS